MENQYRTAISYFICLHTFEKRSADVYHVDSFFRQLPVMTSDTSVFSPVEET